MDPRVLLAIAELLASGALDGRPRRPRQEELRCAVGIAYFALFHTLAACCADLFIGASPAFRKSEAWERVFRSLNHGFAKDQFRNKSQMERFPPSMTDFAAQFILMQTEREKAQYASTTQYRRLDVLSLVEDSRSKIAAFNAAPKAWRLELAAHALLRAR